MAIQDYPLHSPVWKRHNMIDVSLTHPKHGPIIYSCVNNSGEQEMQELWDDLMAGNYGPIAGTRPAA